MDQILSDVRNDVENTVGREARREDVDGAHAHQKQKKNMRIAVLTSGGDSPGMNAALRSIVRTAIKKGIQIFGVYRGFNGLIDGDIEELGWESVDHMVCEGGTRLLTERSHRFRDREGRKEAAYHLARVGISHLIVIGGDGSLYGAFRLKHEFPGLCAELVADGRINKEILRAGRGVEGNDVAEPGQIPQRFELNIVGLPGTIDNDINTTEMSIGADTALHRILETVNRLLSTIRSHRRIFILETMGNKCGWLSVMAAWASGADYVFLPEREYEAEGENGWKKELLMTIETSLEHHKADLIIFLCEGAVDSRGASISLADVAAALPFPGIRTHRIGHVQRGGPTSAKDSIFGTLGGISALERILAGGGDCADITATFSGEEIGFIDFEKTVVQTRQIRRLIQEGKKVLSMRNAAFQTVYRKFEEHRRRKLEKYHSIDLNINKDPKREILSTNISEYNRSAGLMTVRAETGPRVAILNDGEKTPGMNACLNALVQEGLCLGLNMFYFMNGYDGIEKINRAKIFQFRKESSEGSAVIGTCDRREIDVEDVRRQLERHQVDWVVIIGPSRNVEIAQRLGNAVVIPTENGRCVEMCLGYDTALNSILRAVSICKESAESMERMIWIVEVSGKKLCVMGGIASGAFDIISDGDLGPCSSGKEEECLAFIEQLKARLNTHFEGCARSPIVILRGEDALQGIGTDALARLLTQNSNFRAKHCVLGPLGVGLRPSPVDQINANLLAFEALDAIIARKRCGVVGVVGERATFTPIEDVAGPEEHKWLGKAGICKWLER